MRTILNGREDVSPFKVNRGFSENPFSSSVLWLSIREKEETFLRLSLFSLVLFPQTAWCPKSIHDLFTWTGIPLPVYSHLLLPLRHLRETPGCNIKKGREKKNIAAKPRLIVRRLGVGVRKSPNQRRMKKL